MGNCAWRDAEKPTRILENLCKTHNLNPPIFGENSIKIIDTEFFLPTSKAGNNHFIQNQYFEKMAFSRIGIKRCLQRETSPLCPETME